MDNISSDSSFENAMVTGNAAKDGQPFANWFAGDLQSWSAGKGLDFDAQQYGLRNTAALELKWGVHPAGELRPGGWTGGAAKISLGILVRGRFTLRFRPAGQRGPETACLLTTEGDYVVWSERQMEHIWQAVEDTVLLTVRWPEG